ncbi:unnamed protein product [Linum tenue]|uniref:Uncharacterized protein n=1 Tax=Linum tenue TaxID=586396 RepID=A0AAV0HR11_9ROSI|nr:unnamed protein product [Linum tenue]
MSLPQLSEIRSCRPRLPAAHPIKYQPIITTSEPSSTAPNSGSSHQRTASDKAFLDSDVIADPYPPQRTEHDLVSSTPFNKGSRRTLTEALVDMAEAEMARHPPLPPDYDSDARNGVI